MSISDDCTTTHCIETNGVEAKCIETKCIEASCVFNANAAQLWELLEDFAHIERWWSRGMIEIDHIVLEGNGIGMIRHIHNVGMPHPISERLDYLDPQQRVLQLSIVGERPAGLTAYRAIGKIIELPNEHCRLDYRGEFVAAIGREHEAREFLQLAYDLMFKGLSAALARD